MQFLNNVFSNYIQYLHELDDLRTQLSFTQATAEASAASAKSAQMQCLSLLKELNEKDISLKEHELRVNKLGEQLDLLQKDLQARELSQMQLKDEVIRIETDIMDAVAKAGSRSDKDNELLKILSDVSPRNVQNLNNLLNAKDTEIARLREEIRILSAHWTNKTKELESQVCYISFIHTDLHNLVTNDSRNPSPAAGAELRRTLKLTNSHTQEVNTLEFWCFGNCLSVF
jgi:chromosome segregation ATPase